MAEKVIIPEVEEYISQGKVLSGAEKYEDARISFDKALSLDPRNVDAYICKGASFAFEGKNDEAEDCFQKAYKLDKNNAETCFNMGNISLIKDRYGDAIKYYNYAINNGLNDGDVYFQLGLAYEFSEQNDDALRYYSKAIRIDELNAKYRVKKAILQYNLADYEGTLETTEEIRKTLPDSFEGYHLAAAALSMLDRNDEAEEILKKACEMFPEDVDIILDLVRVNLAKGNNESAKEMLQIAMPNARDDADRKEILVYLAKIFISEEKSDEAIECLQKSLNYKENPEDDFESRFLLLNIYNEKKEYSKMLEQAEEIKKANSEDPYGISGYYFTAYAKKLMEYSDYKSEYEEAIKYYRFFSLKEPSRIDACIYRAMSLRDIEEYDKAIEVIDYVLVLSPNDRNLHFIRSNILKEAGKTAEAEEEMKKVKNMPGTLVPGLF